jgi:hypothetical protein
MARTERWSRLADAGQLPMIARMRAQGLWGELEAFDGP